MRKKLPFSLDIFSSDNPSQSCVSLHLYLVQSSLAGSPSPSLTLPFPLYLSSKHKKVVSIRIYIVSNGKIALFTLPSNSCASKWDVHLFLIYSSNFHLRNQIVHLLKEDSWKKKKKEDSWVVKGKPIFPIPFFNFPSLIWKWKKDELSLAIELPDTINGVLCIFLQSLYTDSLHLETQILIPIYQP